MTFMLKSYNSVYGAVAQAGHTYTLHLYCVLCTRHTIYTLSNQQSQHANTEQHIFHIYLSFGSVNKWSTWRTQISLFLLHSMEFVKWMECNLNSVFACWNSKPWHHSNVINAWTVKSNSPNLKKWHGKIANFIFKKNTHTDQKCCSAEKL